MTCEIIIMIYLSRMKKKKKNLYKLLESTSICEQEEIERESWDAGRLMYG